MSIQKTNAPVKAEIKKIYYLFATQTGINAPVASILADTVGGPVWSRLAAGSYLITKAGAFTAGKTTPGTLVVMYDDAGNKITINWVDVNSISVKTYAASNTAVLADGVLNGHEMRIEIYL